MTGPAGFGQDLLKDAFPDALRSLAKLAERMRLEVEPEKPSERVGHRMRVGRGHAGLDGRERRRVFIQEGRGARLFP